MKKKAPINKVRANLNGQTYEKYLDLKQWFLNYGYSILNIKNNCGFKVYDNNKQFICYVFEKGNIFSKKDKGFRYFLKSNIEDIRTTKTGIIPQPEWLIYFPKENRCYILEYKNQSGPGSVDMKIPGSALWNGSFFKEAFKNTNIDYIYYIVIGGEYFIKNKNKVRYQGLRRLFLNEYPYLKTKLRFHTNKKIKRESGYFQLEDFGIPRIK